MKEKNPQNRPLGARGKGPRVVAQASKGEIRRGGVRIIELPTPVKVDPPRPIPKTPKKRSDRRAS
jgi:hypothetical protein